MLSPQLTQSAPPPTTRKKTGKAAAKTAAEPADRAGPDSGSRRSRFSAKGLKASREKLGLSADNYGKLVGVSGLSIYNWEQGKARPRESSIAALMSIRGIGKREAARRLGEPATPKTRTKTTAKAKAPAKTKTKTKAKVKANHPAKEANPKSEGQGQNKS